MKIYHVTKIGVKKYINRNTGSSTTSDYSRDGVIATEDSIVDSEHHYEETTSFGTVKITTGVKVNRVDEYENVDLDRDPGKFYNMQSWLQPCEDPTKDKLNKIPALVDFIRPYSGRGLYLGEKNGMKFFVTPEVSGNAVKFTSFITT